MFFAIRKNGDMEVNPLKFESYQHFFTQKYPLKHYQLIDKRKSLRDTKQKHSNKILDDHPVSVVAISRICRRAREDMFIKSVVSRQNDINSVLNFQKNNDYALWQSLSDELGIARYSFNPASGKNQRTEYRSVILNYQDARGLFTP